MEAHAEVMAESAQNAFEATDQLEVLALGFDAFLDAVLRPDIQRIIVVDGPAVLGLARFTELDERDAFGLIVTLLEAAMSSGRLAIEDPGTTARLLLGVGHRGAMLIANSAQPVETSQSVARSIRALLTGLSTPAG